ncbi:MAG: DUF1579 family protein [Fimbriimonadaceae bacterium]|nr:DUF1579 family protein [Fimbriimonadaceae bacterium]
MEMPKATPTHEFLRQFAGDWVSRPDDVHPEPVRESAVMIGDMFVQITGKQTSGSENSGGVPMVYQFTLGFDPEKGKVIGTFIGNMMAMMWQYEGDYDADANALVLFAHGPRFDGEPGTARYRDTLTLHPDGTRTLESATEQPDGTFHRFMFATYDRA